MVTIVVTIEDANGKYILSNSEAGRGGHLNILTKLTNILLSLLLLNELHLN